MEIKQVASLLNDVLKEDLGLTTLVAEDLSDVISVGETVANAKLYDSLSYGLVNRISRTIFSMRKYTGRIPSLIKDEIEYGSIIQKVHMELPDAEDNESFELVDGATYEENQYYKSKVYVKLFNHIATFEIPVSITEVQLKQSFTGRDEMMRFVGMIFEAVENSLTLKFDELVMRCVNYAIASVIQDGTSGVTQIHLVTEYNSNYGASLTSANALYNKDFLRYCVFRMRQVATRLSVYSTLFNVGATQKHTPREDLRIVLHETLDAGVSAFLQSDTFHDELVKLPQADVIPFWQGSGTGFALADTTKINVQIFDKNGTKQSVTEDYIVGVMFDRDAMGVSGYDKHVTSKWNAKGEFWNYWYKEKGQWFYDQNENVVVFLAD